MKKIIKRVSSLILLTFLLCFNAVAAQKNRTSGLLNQIANDRITFKQQQIEQRYEKEEEQIKTYLGDYRVTFYCGGSCCCGEWAGSPTASGTWPEANHTCACGSDIPYGTVLYVEGLGYYVCEDRGVGSGCIDIYVNDHSQIPSWGLAYIATYQVQ